LDPYYFFKLRDCKKGKEHGETTQMKDISANSKSAIRLSNERKAADYIYQVATVVAALLLVLSAAV
jgi:hypothetical protein